MNEFETIPPRAAIAHARVSTVKQVEFAIDRQITQIRDFAKSKGIDIIGEERLEGVSGLDPTACADVDRIIQRKVERDDFDAIILADVDRLTRAGVPHGFHIMHMLNEHGIQVLFARNDVPPGPYGWLFFALKCAEANADIKGITKRLLEGWQKAAEGQRVTHSCMTPYACDKLVSTAEGVPMFRVRRSGDGSYKILEPDNENVIRIITKSNENSIIQFKNQKSDRMTLVPGDPERVAVVREAFELRYGPKALGLHRIAKYLNTKKAPSHRGARWTRRVVANLLTNPCYLGLGISNVATKAKLMMRGTGASVATPPRPITVGRNLRKLRRPKLQYRDPKDWRFFPYPKMEGVLDNLPADIRVKALADLLTKLRLNAERNRSGVKPDRNSAGRKSGGSRHSTSSYLLSGLLYCEVENVFYRGHASKGDGRYYINLRCNNAPEDGIKASYLPARILEPMVLSVIASCILDAPSLRATIAESVEMLQQKRAQFDPLELPRLKKSERDLLKQIETMTIVHCDMKPEHLRAMVEPLKARHREAAAALHEAEVAAVRVEKTPIDLGATTERVFNRLRGLLAVDGSANAEQNAAIKALLKVIVKRLSIHPKTFAVHLAIGIPSWFVKNLSADHHDVGVVTTTSACPSDETTSEWVDIASFSGHLVRWQPDNPDSRWKALVLNRVA